MWLLNFLLQVYNYVIDWFSSNYVRWRNDINGLPQTLLNIGKTIRDYYNLAVQAISPYVTSFYNLYVAPAFSLLEGLINNATILANQAYGYIAGIANIISNAIANLRNELIGYFRGIYDSVIAGLHNLVNWIVNTEIPRLSGYINTLLPFQSWISQAANLLDISKLRKLMQNFDKIIDTTLLFVSNPLGFILGLFWQYAIMFLAFVIGYALGAVNEDLPSIPNWNNIARK